MRNGRPSEALPRGPHGSWLTVWDELTSPTRTPQVLRRRFAESATGPLPERPDPRRTSVVAGTRVDLLDGLESLGSDLAEPLALRDVLDMPYRRIATLLDLPEGTVKSRIHEGRRRLRGWLIDDAT